LELIVALQDRRRALVYAMLALLPFQAHLEHMYCSIFAPEQRDQGSTCTPNLSRSLSSSSTSAMSLPNLSSLANNPNMSKNDPSSPSSSPSPSPSSSPSPASLIGAHLANTCLEAFAQHTNVAIVAKRIDFRQQNLRISLCATPRTRNRVTGRALFRYAPCYTTVTGFDLATGTFPIDTLMHQRHQLLDAMVDTFWHAVQQQRYMPDDSLQRDLSHTLWHFFAAGLPADNCQAASFIPLPTTTPLNMYLYCTAGIGKTSFVKAFRAALQHTVCSFLDTDKRVSVVKLPLNSVSPNHLNSMLQVKGISDMSIERMLEQTLCKGHIVIFHLEENPQDLQLQELLFSRTQLMLSKLMARYPEYRANIICIFTSNYEPVPTIISAGAAKFFTVAPPSPLCQRRWCVQKLHDVLVAETPLHSVSIDFADELAHPPETQDLRPLERWWMSLAYQLARHIAPMSCSSTASASSLSPSALALFPPDARTVAHIQLHTDDHSSELLAAHITITSTPSSSSSSATSTSTSTSTLDRLQLAISNRFFCHKRSPTASALAAYEHLSRSNIAQCMLSTVCSIIEMAGSSYLKPGVLVVHGASADSRAQCSLALLTYIQQLFADRLRYTTLDLRTENDKYKVIGQPGEILGGLFRFIDRVNNINACDDGRTDLVGLVVANVNDMGQFILRDLLEPDASRTHRQVHTHSHSLTLSLSLSLSLSLLVLSLHVVSRSLCTDLLLLLHQTVYKDRIIFIVVLDNDCTITPQLYSRAHGMLQCIDE
jgi:hypothetical protein